jgi:hypothetical protein
MVNGLETLCSWELEMLPNGSDEIINDLNVTLARAGFKKFEKEGYWDNKTFRVFPIFLEGRPYYKLKIDFKGIGLTTTPLIELIEHSIRKHGNYIHSIKFEKNPSYLKRE